MNSTTNHPSPQPMYCRACGYDLRLLPENRCPDCGRPFDPADPGTYRRRPPQAKWRWVRRAAMFLLILALSYGGLLGWLWWEWRDEQPVRKWVATKGGHCRAGEVGAPWIRSILPPSLRWLRERATELELPAGGKDTARTANFADADMARLIRLKHLGALEIRNSALTDRGVALLVHLPELSSITLGTSQLTNDGLAVFGQLPRLLQLSLMCPGLTDAGMARLKPGSRLKFLYLSSLRIESDGLRHLSALPALFDLNLCNCQVIAPASLASLDAPSLVALNFGEVSLSDEHLAQLSRANLPSLQLLGLDKSPSLTPAGLRSLQTLPALKEISVNDAELSRAIPTVLPGVTARPR